MMSRDNTRRARRHATAIERKALRTGGWRPWEKHEFAPGSVGGDGWTRQIAEAWSNGLYVVLVRPLDNGVVHLAIRTPSQLEPPWAHMQRIKNELFGPERVAVQVCPAETRLVDAADMYHLWVYPEGYALGFGLDPRDEEAT